MNSLWGDEVLPAETLDVSTRLYLGALRLLDGQMAMITKLDRETRIAEYVFVPSDAVLDPEWWNQNNLAGESTASWDKFKSVPASTFNKIKIWPPMPVMLSGLVQDFQVQPEIRSLIPAALQFLAECAERAPQSNTRDTYVLYPRLYGAPHIAWHRNGKCVAGIHLDNLPAQPNRHDSACSVSRAKTVRDSAGLTTQSASGLPFETEAKRRRRSASDKARLNTFRKYVTESAALINDAASTSTSGPIPLARSIEVFFGESCECARIPGAEQGPISILMKGSGNLVKHLRQKAAPSLERILHDQENEPPFTQAKVNAHARRLSRYGLTATRKVPRPISEAAAKEISKLSNSTSNVMIRFGPAGSGKTSLLAALAGRLSLQGKKVAVVTFTQASKRVIETRIETETIANRDQIEYFKITELVPSAHKARIFAAANAQKRELETRDFTQDLFDVHTDEADSEIDDSLFDVLLVDEAEDFTAEMWSYLLGRDHAKNWPGGRNLGQICVAFDDAQGALGGKQRTFETQAPSQWTKKAFASQTNDIDGLIRPEFISQPDFGWLTHNVRQMSRLSQHSSEFRRTFRPKDPIVQTGFLGADESEITAITPKSWIDTLIFIEEQFSAAQDLIVVCPERVTVAAITLWLERPGQLITQSEFFDDSITLNSHTRGDKARKGIWLEAPEIHTEPVKTVNGEILFEDVNAMNCCRSAHRALVYLDQTSKDSVRPTDSRSRVLTYSGARGHEANTAIVLIPDEDWFKPELEYIGISRSHQRLVRVRLPSDSLIQTEQSDAGRLLRALELLRVGAPTTEAPWPRLQVDVWRWQRSVGLDYLERDALEKVLQWFNNMRKQLDKKPEWRGQTHCLDDAFSPTSTNRGAPEQWRDYGAWIGRIEAALRRLQP
jgi:hypothetical protein